MAPSFVVTGVPRSPHTQGATPPVRLEINDFIKHDRYFSLYVQALTQLYERDQTDLLSWYQLAGIHGLPNTSWDDSPGGESGYCQHGTVLFPTWHRPYVALVEQVIQETAMTIASRYTTYKDQWQQAAATLRQPYWNWGSKPLLPDQIISQGTLTIETPEGWRTVQNPFLFYRFHPICEDFPPDANKYPTTLRYPTTHDSDAKSSVKSLKKNLQGLKLSRDVYNLFLMPTWKIFSHRSNDGGLTQGGISNSLEGIHDTIHTTVGGIQADDVSQLVGHMADPSIAAFDPIFWLHHSQVDRLLSMWAAFHPDAWVADPDLHTDLLPFWNTKATFWKSSNCTSAEADLNYTYPDFVDGVALASLANDIKTAHAPASLVKLSTGTAYQWTARVTCNKYELGGRSFDLYFFLGPIPQDRNEWASSENSIGVVSAFVNGAADSCANCQKTAQDGIVGFVHLDDGMAEHAHLDSFDPEVVKPYLRENLRWDVIGNGTLEDLKSLEVTILRTPLTFNEGAHFPSVGEPFYYHEVTRGMIGGSRA